MIGDTHTAALVGRNGSIDWLCLPRFDSGACFAALLGDETRGRWLLSPTGTFRTRRRYRADTLVLETEHETDTGSVHVTDFMTPRRAQARVVCCLLLFASSWPGTASIRRPHAFQACALPTELPGREAGRAGDPPAVLTGFEPASSALTGRRANQTAPQDHCSDARRSRRRRLCPQGNSNPRYRLERAAS